MGKKPELLFTEFEGTYKTDTSTARRRKISPGLFCRCSNAQPQVRAFVAGFQSSHLEFVNPVIEGISRAKQDDIGDVKREQVIPIAIHGDAAFAGQGVCFETLQLSQLDGYSTGGTLHIVINNQVGFTTNPTEGRTTTYATDLAKMLEVPIFHVNGDEPEAVWYAAKVCVEYRQKFKKDAFIDLICYRSHGQNEGDEPTFTQPLLYKKIKTHASTREIYANRLVQDGTLSAEGAQALVDQLNEQFTAAQVIAKKELPHPPISAFEGKWKTLRHAEPRDLFVPASTSVADGKLKELAGLLSQVKAGFKIHPKLARFLDSRLKAVQEGKGIDWGNGEALAFASLLDEGITIRLSGQDVERGTFTHRHAILNDFETGEKYCPLNHLRTAQGSFDVHNSSLSETGVLGFEYGYALADPSKLVIWEAQFGDFANSAQVIIDQFIASTESKWRRMCGMVLLLPHGFEGQGPEHSSARLERFLQLCGRDNLIVANLTTPAQLSCIPTPNETRLAKAACDHVAQIAAAASTGDFGTLGVFKRPFSRSHGRRKRERRRGKARLALQRQSLLRFKCRASHPQTLGCRDRARRTTLSLPAGADCGALCALFPRHFLEVGARRTPQHGRVEFSARTVEWRNGRTPAGHRISSPALCRSRDGRRTRRGFCQTARN